MAPGRGWKENAKGVARRGGKWWEEMAPERKGGENALAALATPNTVLAGRI
jgi:hypothetical protein